MKTCLVVDDSSVIRKVARRILEGLDFQIAEAENGEEAIVACRQQIPDAILLDSMRTAASVSAGAAVSFRYRPRAPGRESTDRRSKGRPH